MKSLVSRHAGVIEGAIVCLALTVSACGGVTTGTDEGELGSVHEELITACPAGYPNNGGITIIGTDLIDNIVGTAGGDCILAKNGPDVIDGLGGDDFIAGGSGTDTIHGGDGNDYIRGETGNDTLFGDAGDDRVLGDEDDDNVDGGDGGDTLKGGIGNDVIHGRTGNDVIEGEAGDDQLFGEEGADNIKGFDGNDTIDAGADNDYAEGNNGADNILGGSGDDKLYGFAGDDIIDGGDGSDQLFGGNENDTLNGGLGADILRGEIGTDQLNGGLGDDTLYGGADGDTLHGNEGNDKIFGEDGNDQLFGDDGDDRMAGGNGLDIMSGGNGNDLSSENNNGGSIAGDSGNDASILAATMTGGNGTDACTGTSCELAAPVASCSACGAGRRCATEVGFCIYCQSDSECAVGQQCVPTLGCRPAETNCTNGLDDDNDGDIDCSDSDCVSNASCRVSAFGGGVGNWHQCALNSTNQVACWGRNNLCQLGNVSESDVPRVVTGITSPTMVRTGSYNSCALEAAGTVRCWGASSNGALGDGGTFTGDCTRTPTLVAGLTTATQVSTGEYYACAVEAAGTVKCWGRNNYGQLGDGTATNRSSPVAVTGITTAKAVSAGTQTACALLANGTVQCWGRNNRGQLGGGTVGGSNGTPTTVTGLTNAVSISAGQEFACSIATSGGATQLKCWGDNVFGQLGQGSTGGQFGSPLTVSSLTSPIAVEAGARHVCALRQGGDLRCWGLDTDGQVGAGAVASARPLPVFTNPPLTGISQLAMGRLFSCAKSSGGTVSCWGDNQYGEIAADKPTDHPSPTTKAGL